MTADLARLIPLLSEADTAKGIDAVIDTLRDIGVLRFDPRNDRLIFAPMEASANVLYREVRRRVDA